MFELTFESKKATLKEPKFLIIYSKPKVGKSSLLMDLPKSLLIDLEDGADFYDGNSLNVTKISREQELHPIKVLKETARKIEEANKESGSPVYDFIVLDSATVLEDLAAILATANYKKTLIGKGFTGKDVVTELPNGQGYNFLRMGFEELYEPFTKLAGKCFILVVHTKDNLLNKDGKEIMTSDLNLTGKSKMITASRADGIAHLYRSKTEKLTNYLSFKGNETDVNVGCRLPYLANKEFKISEMTEEEGLITHWEQIFPSID